MNWTKSPGGLAIPETPPPPPSPSEKEPTKYILVCPRCHGQAKVGIEHESMYSFSCPCGGGRVDRNWCTNDVTAIRWEKAAPLPGTVPAPWKGY